MSSVKNIKPKSTWVQSFTMDPNKSIQIFNLEQTTNLDVRDHNLISYITTSFDTSAIQNITKQETIEIDSVVTILEPGFYDRDYLITLLDIQVPLTGPGSFHTTLNKSIKFNIGSQLIYILGFDFRSDNVNLILPITLPVGSISPYVFDETNGFSSVVVNCSLVSPNSPSGSSSGIQIVNVDVPIGSFIVRRNKINQVIIRPNHNTVQFILNDKFGRLYSLATPITITLEFSIY